MKTKNKEPQKIKKQKDSRKDSAPTYQSKLGQFTYNNPSKTPDTQKKDIPS